MRKSILFAAQLILVQFLHAQTSFKLIANLPTTFNGELISLLFKDDIGKYVLDTKTSTVVDSKVSFTGTITAPSKNAVMEIKKGAKKYTADFVLDTGYHVADITIENESYGYLNVKVSNSLSNQIKYKIDSISRSIYTAYSKKNNIKDVHYELPDQEQYQLNLDYLKLITNYPDNFYSLMRLNYLSRSVDMYDQPTLIVNTYKKFTKRLQESQLGLEIMERIDRRVTATKASRTGQKMFDFTIVNNDGTSYSNSKLINKPYVIVFSATWCVPCQESLPKLKNLYSNYKDKGLEILYYNQDTNFAEWEASVKKHNLDWINLNEVKSPNRLGVKLAINYVPSYIFVDEKGTITFNSLEAGVGINELETYLKKELN